MKQLEIYEKESIIDRLKYYGWLVFLFGLLGVALVALGFVEYAKTEVAAQTREKAAYEAGYKLGQKEAQDELKVDAGAIALQWWAGTSDMKEVRERLCTNVSTKAFIGSDWRKELLHAEQRGVVVSLKFKSQQSAAEYLRYVGKP